MVCKQKVQEKICNETYKYDYNQILSNESKFGIK